MGSTPMPDPDFVAIGLVRPVLVSWDIDAGPLPVLKSLPARDELLVT